MINKMDSRTKQTNQINFRIAEELEQRKQAILNSFLSIPNLQTISQRNGVGNFIDENSIVGEPQIIDEDKILNP